jgi:2-amino-4-hydroxy-6-hydroxymethyldihydropteridine diphosphokinase
MSRFYLSIGSNIHPESNIPASIRLLRETFDVKKISSVYETDPIGPAGDKKFWNLAAEIESSLTREELVSQIRRLEEKLGRKREANKFAPRSIDMDLLPQSGYQEQGFIIIPLAEIAPEAKDPETGKSFAELEKILKKTGAVKKIPGRD